MIFFKLQKKNVETRNWSKSSEAGLLRLGEYISNKSVDVGVNIYLCHLSVDINLLVARVGVIQSEGVYYTQQARKEYMVNFSETNATDSEHN